MFSQRRCLRHLHKEGFQSQHLEALCLCRSCCLFWGAVAGKGGNMRGADHSLQHPCEHLKSSLRRISNLRSFWSFLRCFLMSFRKDTEVQSLLGVYLKQPPQRNGPFSNLHTDIRDGPTCQTPKLSFRMERKCSAIEELRSTKGVWRAWRLLYSLSLQAHRRGELDFWMCIDPVYSWSKSHE